MGTCCLLLQVGAFYEAAGVDALLLVEYAGLNFMGSNLGVPRAGCPEANIHQTLRVLVEEMGLSVVSEAAGQLSERVKE
jgi:DNA mismatch repair ATPase MutS